MNYKGLQIDYLHHDFVKPEFALLSHCTKYEPALRWSLLQSTILWMTVHGLSCQSRLFPSSVLLTIHSLSTGNQDTPTQCYQRLQWPPLSNPAHKSTTSIYTFCRKYIKFRLRSVTACLLNIELHAILIERTVDPTDSWFMYTCVFA